MSGIGPHARSKRPAVQRRALLLPLLFACVVTSTSLADTGSLTVTIMPPEAVAGGAQWRVGTGPWRNSGEMEPNVAVGFQIVTFKHIAGLTAPPSIGFTVAAPALVERMATYYEPMSAAAWGACTNGECNIPAPNTGWTAVATGGTFSLGMRANGSVAGWGQNNFGVLNIPAPNAEFVWLEAGYQTSYGLKGDGSIVTWGRCPSNWCLVPPPNLGFVAMSVGEDHCLALRPDGSIAAFGDGDDGKCDVPAPNTDFVAVAGGLEHSLGLKNNGVVVAWGNNGWGQCIVPPPNAGLMAVAAGHHHSLGLHADGSVVAWGSNYDGQCDVPPPNTDFVAIGASGEASIGIKRDGTVVVWGSNTNGLQNVPTPNERFRLVSISYQDVLALRGVPRGACCLAGGGCSVLTESGCSTAGGAYFGPDTTCEPSPCAPAYCLGDADCSGSVDFFDIDAFGARLGCPASDPVGCAAGCLWQNADVDEDGDVDFFDIDPFVATLGNTCP